MHVINFQIFVKNKNPENWYEGNINLPIYICVC